MSDMDFMGADGGRLSLAFAAGCVATFTFMMSIGGFIWKLIGRSRIDRIEELKTALADEKARCAEMEIRMTSRIEQLETVLLFETVGQVRQNAQMAISEMHQQIRQRFPNAMQEGQKDE